MNKKHPATQQFLLALSRGEIVDRTLTNYSATVTVPKY